MTDLAEGKTLPRLTLPATEVGAITLPDDLQGAWTVLYFYPKDDTPGCTAQACAYRDDLSQLEDAGIRVLGVSMDEVSSHEAFASKYSLGFPLVSDVEHRLSEFLGVYGEQRWKENVYMGNSRDTFLIDPEAKVVRVWRKVDPRTTAKETYSAAVAMREEAGRTGA